jgi:hypothetical protein
MECIYVTLPMGIANNAFEEAYTQLTRSFIDPYLNETPI